MYQTIRQQLSYAVKRLEETELRKYMLDNHYQQFKRMKPCNELSYADLQIIAHKILTEIETVEKMLGYEEGAKHREKLN